MLIPFGIWQIAVIGNVSIDGSFFPIVTLSRLDVIPLVNGLEFDHLIVPADSENLFKDAIEALRKTYPVASLPEVHGARTVWDAIPLVFDVESGNREDVNVEESKGE